jgi:hypothetical protein
VSDLLSGHIKLSRKAFDLAAGDPFWHEHRVYSRWEAWVYVIQLAAFSARQYQTAHGTVQLERGEFVASLRFLAAHFKWNIKSVRTWIAACQKGARLRAQREAQAGTVYLIVNYDAYQSGAAPRGTPEGTPEGTEKAQQGHSKGTRKEQVKAVTTLPALPGAIRSDVDRVLAHYCACHPKRRPGEKDRSLVARSLKTYTPEELCEAIDGNAADDWAQKTGKHELAYALRDNGQIDTYRAKAEKVGAAAKVVDGWFADGAA